MIAQASERERLAAKIRLLVNRAYQRGRDREILREAGYEVTAEPGSWDAYDDYIFNKFKPQDLAGQGQEGAGLIRGEPSRPVGAPTALSLLPGGGEDTGSPVPAVGGRSESRAAAYGRKPPAVVYRQPPGQASNFETEEQS